MKQEFNDWIQDLLIEAEHRGYREYVASTLHEDTPNAWYDMYEDGLSPNEALEEEIHAASQFV